MLSTFDMLFLLELDDGQLSVTVRLGKYGLAETLAKAVETKDIKIAGHAKQLIA